MEKGLVEDKDIARSIKQEFDKKHGPTWHCVVGKHFGKSITGLWTYSCIRSHHHPKIHHSFNEIVDFIVQVTRERLTQVEMGPRLIFALQSPCSTEKCIRLFLSSRTHTFHRNHLAYDMRHFSLSRKVSYVGAMMYI